MADLKILHSDEDILLVNKPSGLLSVPGKSEDHKDCLESRLRAQDSHILLVHRLDMATSGIMIFARNKTAQRHLGLQFEKRYTKKTYEARIWGIPNGQTGHINLPIMTDWPNRPRQKIDFDTGRAAQTDWESTDVIDNITRVRLYPKTGRSHQLRLHMLCIGHPIIGDRLYAHDDAFEAANRLNLHASSLRFRHPSGGEWVEFTAPCPF